MEADLRRLKKLSVFSSVEIVLAPEADGVVYVINVRETAWLVPTVLPNKSEENGWSGGPMLLTPNLFGRAIGASISAQFGGVTKYSFNSSNPWISISNRQLSLASGITYQEREDKIRESDEITSSISFRALFYPGTDRILNTGLGFQYLRTMSSKPGITLSPTNHDHLYRLEFLVRVNSIEDPLDPNEGWIAGFQEMKTGGSLGGDGDSWRTQVDLTRFQPLSDRTTISLGGIFNHQSGVAGQDLPVYLQYSLGGGNSIRGYSRTELGKVLYGNDRLLATAEYSYRVMSPRQIQLLGLPFLSFRVGMAVVAFVDCGVAWSEAEELSLNRSKTGFGVGLHAMVPGIDRIRLDFGFSQDGKMEIHIGTRSKFDAQR